VDRALPAGAVAVVATAEGSTPPEGGAEAERDALRGAALRAEATLTKAEGELVKARADAKQGSWSKAVWS